MPLFRQRTTEDQANSIAYSLPTGELTRGFFVEGTNQRNYLLGLAKELQRYYMILEDVATEHDLNYTQNLINEWERALGIPGTCLDMGGDIETRRRNALIKMNSLHGTTAQDFIDLAALLGFTVTLENASVHGMFPAAFPIWLYDSGKTVKFTLLVHLVATNQPDYFPLEFPFSFVRPENALIECLFNRMKPAFTQIMYVYDV